MDASAQQARRRLGEPSAGKRGYAGGMVSNGGGWRRLLYVESAAELEGVAEAAAAIVGYQNGREATASGAFAAAKCQY